MGDLSLKTVTYTGENGKPAQAIYQVDTRRERFAQLLASGEYTQWHCYMVAFDRPVPETDADRKNYMHQASYLANETRVALRVYELRKPVIRKIRRKLEYNLQKALEQCETAHDLAEMQGNPGMMLKAVELQSKLAKLLSEDINVTHKYGLLDESSTEVLLEMKKEIADRQAKRKAITEVKATNIETVHEEKAIPR